LTEVITVETSRQELERVKAPQVSVIVCIPALNEAGAIGPVVKEARRYSEFVLVCDDGSSDETSEEALSMGAIVFRHSRTMGKGAALSTLFREASKLSPDVVVTLDGDGQHDPADIPRVLGPIIDGSADVVIGSRFNNGNDVPLHRVIGNALLNILTNLAARTLIRDTQSGFRAYSARAASRLSIAEKGMGVDSEIIIDLAKSESRIAERSIRVTYEGDTSTFNPVNHTIQVLLALVRSQAEHKRFPARKLLWLSLVALPVIAALLINLAGHVAVVDGPAIASVGAFGFVATFGLSCRTARSPKPATR